MSLQLINRSLDLKQLSDEGYNIEIKHTYLLVKNIPYVNAARQIQYGTLVSKLCLNNDVTTKPEDHTVFFTGDYPCHHDGTPIEKMRHSSSRMQLGADLWVDHMFSARPTTGCYQEYYSKMTTYAAILSGPAQVIDPQVTCKPFSVINTPEEDESVFRYLDTASSRADINIVTSKLALSKIAIVGLGGTGSYVLDLVAKTPVKEIHLFDGDKFLQHNAFRAPGAASGEDLLEQLDKTVYFQRQYAKMRWGIISHNVYLDAQTIDQLQGMDFVFLCLDRGGAKRLIVNKLEEFDIPFVEVGMGIYKIDNSLDGILRVTTSAAMHRDRARQRISFSDSSGDNEYDQNIQIADLNALNAAMAVIKWKKLFGFYVDLDREYHSTYTIDGNTLISEDKHE